MTLPFDLEGKLKELSADNRSGALELLERGTGVLLELIERRAAGEVLERAARRVMEAQPSMAPLLKVGWIALKATGGGLEAGELTERLRRFLREAREAPRLIAQRAAPLLRDRKVIVLSFSSTVIEALRRGDPREVLCAESRPLCEGVQTAQALAREGFTVRVGVDALVFGRVKEADLVMTGADAVTAQGVVNKVGTYPLAVMARSEGRPFYVLAGFEKLLPPELQEAFRIEGRPPDEVARVEGVRVENVYFDLTPLELITSFVTPRGLMDPKTFFSEGGLDID